jgi:hypothetical protein
MSARAKQKGPSTISIFQYVVVTLGYIVSAAQHSVELSTAVKKRFCSAAAPLVCFALYHRMLAPSLKDTATFLSYTCACLFRHIPCRRFHRI